ncbi:YitT family protein [Rubellimicrobium roseum]|uniref:YitT family protein n=1 Tax=Rubellimicrobium roseum TaxID=687525 RepID=A0A5C4N738_9RHOB|nr:YitT family protein [Rubellimicrobium roseum]TNC67559.1 YitT family protein [Rubellimicrobium roseum]
MSTSTRPFRADASGGAARAVAPHNLLDDAQGLVFGTVMAAVGVTILTHLGLITGQTAGLAVLLSYMMGLPFGAVFFALNLPFFWLGWQRMGPAFTAKTFLAVALVSGLSVVVPGWMGFAQLNPVFGAVLTGLCSGAGLLALFRHGASLGGVGIVAVMIQDRTGFRAGWTQLGFDALLFAAAFLVLDPATVILSALGAGVLNLVIAINHRRDRYVAY